MVWIGCPNCKGQAAYKYSVDFPVKRGFTDPSNDFVTCVGYRHAKMPNCCRRIRMNGARPQANNLYSSKLFLV